MIYYEPIVYIVPPAEDGWLLKTVLQKRMDISRSLLSRLKQTEYGITVNGNRCYINVRVAAGDCVEVRMQQEESADIIPQNIPFEIIAEDDDLLIVNKAAGMIVHPTHGHYTNTLANAVIYYWQQKKRTFRFRPVHRLDQETSGVIAIAKNPFVHQWISQQMISQQTVKEYIALVHGQIPTDQGIINAPIDRSPDCPHLRIVLDTGYAAVTHYVVEQRFTHSTQVRLRLDTGRTHQIRVHMQFIGFPLIGDKLYLKKDNIDGLNNVMLPNMIERHALHAAKLGFVHPTSKQWIEYHADLPTDMQQFIDQERNSL